LTKVRSLSGIIVLAALSGGGFAYGFVPAWRSLNTDFVSYYLAARLYKQEIPLTQVYDWIWFQRQKDHAGIEKRIVPFSPLTLYSAVPIVPFASLSPLTAKRYWLVTSLMLLGLSWFLLHRMTALGWKRVAILTFLAVGPLQTHFLYGQVHILVLFLLVLSLRFYMKNRGIASGVMIALAAALKIYPAFLVFYFIRKKQWRVVAGLAGGAALLAALSVYVFGLDVNRIYAVQVLPRIMRGENIDPYNVNWSSFSALLSRAFLFEPELNPHPFLNVPAVYAVLLALTQALVLIPLLWILTPRRATPPREMTEYATYIAALLVLSTTPALYHYIVLVPCAILAADFLWIRHRIREFVLLIAFYALACLPRLESFPASARLIFISAFFLLLFRILASADGQTWRERLQSRSALVFVPMFVLAVCVAALLTMRHVKSYEDYSARVVTGAVLFHPVAWQDRIAVTVLQPPVYTIGTLSGSKLSTIATETDLFHPAPIPGSSEAMIELAGGVSNIVRVDLSAPGASPESFPVEVENGQQPVVSPDGRWLAFIREDRGRGGLSIKSLHPDKTPDSSRRGERELANPEYDVLEAAFDSTSEAIVFSGRPPQFGGGPALFSVDLTSSQITRITFDSPIRYPAFSGNGEWLAYSKLQTGNWQVWLRSLRSGSEKQITSGECNSISPAWMPDSRELVYATDCGRGVLLTALARVAIPPIAR
jgi:hypothetical protein